MSVGALTRCLAVGLALAALSATAAPTRKKVSKPPPEPPTSPRVGPAAAVPASSVDGVARVRASYDAGNYPEALAAGRELVRRPGLSADEKMELYRLVASCLVIVEDPIEAEPWFRTLLVSKPDYQLPAETPPKIADVFERVKREMELAAQRAEAERRGRSIAAMRLLDPLPEQAKGGRPLLFQFRLEDPSDTVKGVRLHYRRAGAVEFAALPHVRDVSGVWRGEIPAELTASPVDFTVEYWLESYDKQGPLLTAGAAAAPRTVAVSAGSLPRARPPAWLAWAGGVATVASGGLLAGFLIDRRRIDNRLLDPMPLTADEFAGLQQAAKRDYDGASIAGVLAGALATLTVAYVVALVLWSS